MKFANYIPDLRRLALAGSARQLDPGPDTELGENVAQV